MDTLKFTIPGKPEYLTMMRLAIGSVAAEIGFDLDGVEDIKTAVSEACKLVSCHGFDGFSDRLQLECNVEEGSIEIIVEDQCDSHNLEKHAKPCINCPQEGNLGVYVIQTLMNDVKLERKEDGKKFIRMVKNI